MKRDKRDGSSIRGAGTVPQDGASSRTPIERDTISCSGAKFINRRPLTTSCHAFSVAIAIKRLTCFSYNEGFFFPFWGIFIGDDWKIKSMWTLKKKKHNPDASWI
ncbi:hypothetical protein CEXT_595581 [Caerostris extrusa]|uniref:Uncharacterized protein n=1 Tax=Caerostris extrusa TaxID=172846 RepID=A0AAV4XZ00_CAEEX|nr:hypothetical protein CEXT_595581 [Caerostris extrusa]